ncbi:MAG: magnesium transporter [Planctomycetes bacterium]|nr:magnesium transporter [Planctomycetota bacterium]
MYHPLLLPDLRIMLDEDDKQGLAEFCEVLYPAVTAEVLEGLETDEIWQVLSHCDLNRQVEIFEFMSLPRQLELVETRDRKQLSGLLEEMSPDDRADLLARLDKEKVEELLPLIAQAERSDIRKLLSYPEDSAGSIMTTEYASLAEEITVREALDRLRSQAPDRETIYYVYILDEDRRLHGFTSLRDLILAKPDTKLADIMQRGVISVRVDDDQEFVAQEMARYDFLAIPVIDNQNHLVGIITYDDILDIVQEEATEDAHLLGAVSPLEDSYLETPLITISRKRGVWLLVLSVMALFTAEVLHHYDVQKTADLTGLGWMVLFLPLVLASGGNAGAQSATLIIRSLALGEINRMQTLTMARRELLIGAILGFSVGLIGFFAAFAWFDLDLMRATTVASTVFSIVIVGTVCGAMLPILFKSWGMDPALMSTPLIAALVDVMGVIIYYETALLLVGR